MCSNGVLCDWYRASHHSSPPPRRKCIPTRGKMRDAG
jgi:hypothetical protein